MDLFAYLLSKRSKPGETITGEGTSIALENTSADQSISMSLAPSELSQASTPSPSSPQTIHSISGNNTIKIEGKNLLDLTKHTNTLASNTTIIDSNSYSCNATSTWQGLVVLSFTNLKPNTNYTFSMKSTFAATLLNSISGIKDGVTTNLISAIYLNYLPKTFNTSDYDEIKIMIYAKGNYGDNGTIIVSDIQLEEGATASNFVPYVAPQTLPLNLGTNEYCKIGNYADEFYKTSGKNLCPTDYDEYWELGDYDTYGVKRIYENRVRLKDFIEVIPGQTYYFSTNTNNTFNFGARGYDINGDFVGSIGEIQDGGTYTPSSNVYYLGIFIYMPSNNSTTIKPYFEDSTIKPFICLNSLENKSYEPYGKDEWWLKKNTDKITINGTSSNITSITVRTNTVRCFINSIVNRNIIRGDNYNKLYSSHFEGKNLSNDVIGVMTGYNSTYNFGFVIVGLPLEAGSTSASISTYLSGINANLYYPLAYSIYAPLNRTLQEQIEAIYNSALSYQTQTNISQTNADLPFIISATTSSKSEFKIDLLNYILLEDD